jgi:hypothetical protein
MEKNKKQNAWNLASQKFKLKVTIFWGYKNHFTPNHVQKDQSTKWCS